MSLIAIKEGLYETMTAQKLAWGILGTGKIARVFARGVLGSDTGRLVAVGSRARHSADTFADQFAIANRHGSYEALLADPEVEAIYIATLHPFHAEWAIKAAEAGKHVLCEKPLTINHPQAMAVIEAARENNVFLMEAFMYRCHPQTARLVELIREGAIGEVRLIDATFSFDASPDEESRLYAQEFAGGGILDVGCYPLSMARLIAGAANGKAFAEPIELNAVGRIGNTRVDEYTAASATFPGGIVAQLAAGIHAKGENVVRVVGSTGTILIPDPWMPSAEEPSTTRIQLQTHADETWREVGIEASKSLYAFEADTVAAHLAAGQAPVMTWDDSLGNMAALDRWRAQIGLVYDMEHPAVVAPVANRHPAARAKREMQTGTIPGIDKPISRLVLGTDNQRSMPHAAAMYDAFLERGGTCIDTAHEYIDGLSERLVGQWIVNRGVREHVVLLDKGAHTPYCTPEHLTKQLLVSLERLRTEYVDIYMLHRDNLDVPVGEFIEVLNEHQRAGRMRVFGASNWSIPRIEAAQEYARSHRLTGFGAVSNNVSLAEMVEAPWEGCLASSDMESLNWFTRTAMPLFPWSSQARGFFAGIAHPDDRSDPELVRSWYSPTNFARLARAEEMARARGVLPINIALAYVLGLPFPTFPLIGPRTLRELSIAAQALDVTLAPNEVRWLRDGK
jgi:predicted dehydrogenase/aryl-alcohol dehydrogenase-like predicted oxidoreductase